MSSSLLSLFFPKSDSIHAQRMNCLQKLMLNQCEQWLATDDYQKTQQQSAAERLKFYQSEYKIIYEDCKESLKPQ